MEYIHFCKNISFSSGSILTKVTLFFSFLFNCMIIQQYNEQESANGTKRMNENTEGKK